MGENSLSIKDFSVHSSSTVYTPYCKQSLKIKKKLESFIVRAVPRLLADLGCHSLPIPVHLEPLITLYTQTSESGT